ncbi:MAG TPA: hypothetical protein EYP17_06765 [Candidatus Latescibacteria bacterium]|nr:hypothetical protein [Candidatus Latescibacterota bacterium]
MKRLALSVCLVLGFLGTTLGMEKKVDISGRIIYRGRWYNLDFDDAEKTGSLNRQNWYGNLSLTLKFRPTEHVRGCFELAKTLYGVGNYGELVTDELGDRPFRLPPPYGEDEQWEMSLMQAWGEVDLPLPWPVSVKVGKQPLKLGENGLYLNSYPNMTFALVGKADLPCAKLQAGAVKLYEGIRAKEPDDDANIYYLEARRKFGGHCLNAFGAYFKDASEPQDTAKVAGIVKNSYNLGVAVKGQLPVLKYKAEFGYLWGKDKTDTDIKGYFVMARADCPKGHVFLEFGWGSGDDPATADKIEAYLPPGPFYAYAWAYEYRFIHWLWNSSRAHIYTKGLQEPLAPGLEATVYVKLGFNWKLSRWRISGQKALIYLGHLEGYNPMDTDKLSTFGYEIDSIVNWKLYKNFSYQFILGYVIPGDYVKDKTPGDPAWGIRSQFAFTF